MLSPFLIPGMLFAAALTAAIGLHCLIVREGVEVVSEHHITAETSPPVELKMAITLADGSELFSFDRTTQMVCMPALGDDVRVCVEALAEALSLLAPATDGKMPDRLASLPWQKIKPRLQIVENKE